MSFDVSVAGAAMPTDVSALQSFKNELNLAFHLGSEFKGLLDSSLSAVPASNARTAVGYGPSNSWNPGGGAITFALSGSSGGEMVVVTAGNLVEYTDGLDSPQQKWITVPPGKAYVKLSLLFSIGASVDDAWSGGAYGVKAAVAANACYTVTFCKAFAPTTVLRIAIMQTLHSFVLPLHPDTLKQMSDGDYLLYDFDGNLHLSFGAYTGVSKVAYAGQGTADIVQALGKPMMSLKVEGLPKATASANLDFSFGYENKFEALLSRDSAASAKLHLFRAKKTDTQAKLSALLTFDANASCALQSGADKAKESIANSLSGSSVANNVLDAVLDAGSGELDKYVSEVNSKIGTMTRRGNGFQTNLEASIEVVTERMLLATYDFNLASPDFANAWSIANNGDFAKALISDAVDLEPGSGLEQSYQSKTAFTANFFNLWHWTSWSDFASNSQLVYAGNSIFHLISRVGRDAGVDTKHAISGMNFYFSLASDVAASGGASKTNISLNLDLSSKGDKDATARIAKLLLAIGGTQHQDVVSSLQAFAGKNPQGTIELHISVPQPSFSHIQCDPYSNGRTTTNSTSNDAANWNKFAQAATTLDAWVIPDVLSGDNAAYMQTFAAWTKLNATMNDTPNRLATTYNTGSWPSDFPSLDQGKQRLIIWSMVAGQSFMNFCASVKALADATDSTSVTTSWQELLKYVTAPVKDLQGVDFVQPTMLAFINACTNSQPKVAVEAPSQAAAPDDHFSVKVTLLT